MTVQVLYGTVRCRKCGHVFVDAGYRDAQLGFAQYLFQIGAGTGEDFVQLRQALGYRGGQVAQLLGVRPETISRWEHTEGPVDRAAWMLLGALVEDRIACRTTTEDRLFAALNPQLPKAPVTLAAPPYDPKRPGAPREIPAASEAPPPKRDRRGNRK